MVTTKPPEKKVDFVAVARIVNITFGMVQASLGP